MVVTSPPSIYVSEMHVKMCLPKEVVLEVLNAVQETLYFLKGRNNRMSAATE